MSLWQYYFQDEITDSGKQWEFRSSSRSLWSCAEVMLIWRQRCRSIENMCNKLMSSERISQGLTRRAPIMRRVANLISLRKAQETNCKAKSQKLLHSPHPLALSQKGTRSFKAEITQLKNWTVDKHVLKSNSPKEMNDIQFHSEYI
jgi:ribosomal protein L17